MEAVDGLLQDGAGMTDVIVIVAFLALDIGLVVTALMRLSAHRQDADPTDMRRRHPRHDRD